MSVIVKGMQMPENCQKCLLDGQLWGCPMTGKSYNWGLTTRPSDCPLVEIPAPHGGLIDIDRLKKVFDINVVSAGAFDVLFDNAPTVIEAEE